jgi:hypothetical protein
MVSFNCRWGITRKGPVIAGILNHPVQVYLEPLNGYTLRVNINIESQSEFSKFWHNFIIVLIDFSPARLKLNGLKHSYIISIKYKKSNIFCAFGNIVKATKKWILISS